MGFSDRRRAVAFGGLFAVFGALSVGGCSSGTPYAESSRKQATVTGSVTSQGKPVTTGKVIFDPANVNRPNEPAAMAEIGKDGRYEVKTLIGANRVTVAMPGRRTPAGSPYVQQICEVQSGNNTFDIMIP